MDLMKLQNLLNECIMIEQGNYLGGNFSVDLAEAQAELDQAKQLLIQRVSQQRELLIALIKYYENAPLTIELEEPEFLVDKFLAINCG